MRADDLRDFLNALPPHRIERASLEVVEETDDPMYLPQHHTVQIPAGIPEGVLDSERSAGYEDGVEEGLRRADDNEDRIREETRETCLAEYKQKLEEVLAMLE